MATTVKGVYEDVLRDIRKVSAPALHLEDFLYLLNKSIQQRINGAYSLFETSQQWSDYLQPLVSDTQFVLTQTGLTTSTGVYNGVYVNSIPAPVVHSAYPKYGSDYFRFALPNDYWHLTGVNVNVETLFPYKCYPAGFAHSNTAKYLDADHGGGVNKNSYLKPAYNRPYYQIGDKQTVGGTVPDISIFVGDASRFRLAAVTFDYLKRPQPLNLTPVQRDAPFDNSPLLEWPEYVIYEITNRVVELHLENAKDPRLQSFGPVNTTVPPSPTASK